MKFSCIALFAMALGSLQASPLLSCPSTNVKCNGNEYAVFVLSQVGNTFQLELDIHVLNTYTGNQFTDLVNSVQLKNFASGTITNTSIVSAPGGLSLWNPLSANELSANTCERRQRRNRTHVRGGQVSIARRGVRTWGARSPGYFSSIRRAA